MQYDEARKTMAGWLMQHANESPAEPHAGYDEIDHGLARSSDPQWKKLFVALNFWDGWIDASNHEWQHYEPITAKDWPVLAREIAANLESDKEISNPVILKQFGVNA
jgi:hypothetical protein